MCGIAGYISKQKGLLTGPRLMQSMCDDLAHRGPDDEGIEVTDNVGLGQRRLAILDLSAAGHQPMQSEDGRFSLVFNGEIYNYKELATTFFPNKKFISSSDTEVLLHLLILKGTEAIPLLKGMFAFAFYDHQKKELLLARDAFGKKPLFYLENNEYIAFASESKALLHTVKDSLHITEEDITKYFLFEYVPSPNTGFKEIKQLPMGHYMTVINEKIQITEWWKPSFAPKHQQSAKEFLSKLDDLLAKAVERRLISDVPVGVFLSGGLDSTTILWYMRSLQKNQDIHSFSIVFKESSFNEESHAELAAKALSSTHHSYTFSAQDVPGTMNDIMKTMDALLADASLLPTFMLSKKAKEHVTVVLDGDGSDELLGGYGTFKAAQAAEKLKNLPGPLLTALVFFSQVLPTQYSNFSFDFKVKSFVKGLGYSRLQRNQIWLGSFSEKELQELLTPQYQKEIPYVFNEIERITQETSQLSLTDQISHATIVHYLHNDILVKLDRATMMVGLEARTPFLDLDVAEFLMRLPEEYKQDKNILKILMKGRIPDSIINRPKKGFGIPLGSWFRGPLREWLLNNLSKDAIEYAGVLQYPYVQTLINEHIQGKADHRKKLWTLITFQLWYSKWIKQYD